MKKHVFRQMICVWGILISAIGCSDNDKNSGSGIANSVMSLKIECVAKTAATVSNTPINSLSLSVINTHISGNQFDTSSSEIVSYDSCSDRLYVVNAEDKSVDILNLNRLDSSPTKAGTINLSDAGANANTAIGSANSVVAKNGLVAIAIENKDKQSKGIVAIYRSDTLALINTYTVGSLPDMVAMTDDSRYILVANEGEPSGDYSIDPEGSVTIIDIEAGLETSKALVKRVGFDDFNDGATRANELNSVRLTRPNNATVAQDLEPEYIALTQNGKAVISLQENNAMAVIDIATAHIESITGLGVKSWSSIADGGAQLDLTNEDKQFNLRSYPQLVGYYMPDSIASFRIKGTDYIISANEGDGREYIYPATQFTCELANHQWEGDNYAGTPAYKMVTDGCISYTDEVHAIELDVAGGHPLMSLAAYGKGGIIADKNAIGGVKVVKDKQEVSVGDNIYTFGARSFSIWNINGERIFDSGSELSKLANSTSFWNMSNDSNTNDDRSDDKGVEPEAIEVAVINGQTLAFVGLERHGGVAVYNVSEPNQPILMDYLNNRDFTVNVCTLVNEDGECSNGIYNPAAGDLGPESIEYFNRIGRHFIAVGNEVSGTTTIYELKLN